MKIKRPILFIATIITIYFGGYIMLLVGCQSSTARKQCSGRVFVRYANMRTDTLQLNWEGNLKLYEASPKEYNLTDENCYKLAIAVVSFSIIEQKCEEPVEKKTEEEKK